MGDSAAPAIVRSVDGGFVIHATRDGGDYWRLVKACIDERIDQQELIRNLPAKPDIPIDRDGIRAVLKPIVFTNPKRMVFRLEWEGRAFILKRAFMGTIGLRRVLPTAMGVTYFTRVMKLVDAAVRGGCRSTQGYYLVAERWLSFLRQEVWVLLEYVEGKPMPQSDVAPRKQALVDAVEDLLRHNLTLDDLSLGNFLDNGEIVRAIDISCRPFVTLQSAKMRLKMNALYGLGLPMRNAGERIAAWLLGVRYRVRKALGMEGLEG